MLVKPWPIAGFSHSDGLSEKIVAAYAYPVIFAANLKKTA